MPWAVSDRIMTMRLPLSKDNFATIISVYAPTMTNPDLNKESFYNQLASVLSGIPRTDSSITAVRILQCDEGCTQDHLDASSFLHHHWYMIDFIITKYRDKMDIHSTRAMGGC
ncbi:hypothetical protein NP493_1490g00001 [Ridgeia piscesae]|uniref:Uncharacterized protein n=1 Tax=Ridgeia piscesae TaxID=27915 RepID=A0AAD9K121_RIDPI|nr:hypothetical protein NP493_1490g00001 [Ridgeia piscesae]